MTHTELDTLLMGATGGILLGSWLGYRLRMIAERVANGGEVPAYRRKTETRGEIVVVDSAPGWETIQRAPREKRQLIPIARSERQVMQRPLDQVSDRDDVITALTGAGYSKKTAQRAVDECTLPERSCGVEAWTVAALRHAQGSK